METEKVEWGQLFSFIALIIMAASATFIQDVSNTLISIAANLTQSNSLKLFLWIGPVIVSIFHYHKVGAGGENRIVLIKDLGASANTLLTGITYGQLLGTSYNILGKAFRQHYLGEQYFVGFTSWDLLVVVMLVGYLWYWSLMKLYRMCSDIFLIDDVGEVVSDE